MNLQAWTKLDFRICGENILRLYFRTTGTFVPLDIVEEGITNHLFSHLIIHGSHDKNDAQTGSTSSLTSPYIIISIQLLMQELMQYQATPFVSTSESNYYSHTVVSLSTCTT